MINDKINRRDKLAYLRKYYGKLLITSSKS